MIRPYTISDYEHLKRILKEEGVEDIEFEKGHKTFIYNNGVGFFTYRYEHDMPTLIHFCLDKKFRQFSNAVKLTRTFVEIVRLEDYSNAIVHAPHEKAYLNTLIKYFFRVKPYKVDDEYSFYLVEV